MNRRRFLGATGLLAVGARRAMAQEVAGASMEGDGYRPVRLPPRSAAGRQLTDAQRDELEHRISCPCPCTLDVYTCRTSMPCGFSPRMHGDVIRLVEGGYSADEILKAFVSVYGEEALMAPTRSGFNWVGWLAPFAAIATGGAVLTVFLRRWNQRAAAVRATREPIVLDVVGATTDELEQLERSIRDDSR